MCDNNMEISIYFPLMWKYHEENGNDNNNNFNKII